MVNLAHFFSNRPKAPESAPAADAPPPFVMESFGMTDRGQSRGSNEDCFVVAHLARTLQVRQTNLPQSTTTFSCHRGHVFLVADGVGGSTAGEVASGLCVTSIEDFLLNTLKRFSNLQPTEEQSVLADLQHALFQADARIFEETTTHPEWRGMATTLTMAFAVNWRLFIAHAGDSRCYLYAGKQLQQLTQDHTMTAELVRRGVIEAEHQARHPLRHVVTNILGGSERGVQADLHCLDLHPGDVLLLCSDGLTEMVPEERIALLLEQDKSSPKRACERLIYEANMAGGRDNITGIVAHVKQ